jgi:serine/threonine-protein kinase PpkA
MAESEKNEELPEIPGFSILKTLGRGGMANVYLGLQESMEREVAIKVMLPQLLTDPSFGDRFLREARIAAKLAHPHIVAVIDVGVAGDMYYMAMEYHPGGDLKAKIRKGLGQKEAIRIMKDIAGALDYAHKTGFVHRDIKPDNILFSRSGSAVLSDFGIARAADGGTHLTATGSVVGTPHYMSPEQAQGKQVDGRADLYSLGIMFYQMLVGTVPFNGDSALSIGIKHIRDPIPRLPEGLSKYQTFLDKLLAKEPDDRWQTGADVVRTLEVLEAEGSLSDSDTLAATMISGQVQATVVSGQVDATQAMPSTVTGVTPKKSKMGLVLGVIAVAAIGAGVAWQQGLIGATKSTPVAQQAAPTVDGVAVKINQLLAKGETEFAAGHYLEPAGSNAFQKYQAVLALDENNQKAKEGLRSISDFYVANARKAADNGKTVTAAKALEHAKQADASNPKITVAQAEIDTVIAARKKKKTVVAKATPPAPQPESTAVRLDKTLSQITDYLTPSRLSESRLQEATHLYETAKGLSPRDRRVRRLPKRIAGGYESLADEQRLNQNWDEARRLARIGLQLNPRQLSLKILLAKVRRDEKAAAREANTRRRAFGGF